MNETWTDEVIERKLYGDGLYGIGYFGTPHWEDATPVTVTWSDATPATVTWTEETS